jgi:hypothetical protein
MNIGNLAKFGDLAKLGWDSKMHNLLYLKHFYIYSFWAPLLLQESQTLESGRELNFGI